MIKQFDLDKLITRDRLTAAHYLANSWVHKQIAQMHHFEVIINPKSLDFGAKRSELCMILASQGYTAFALDRDPDFVRMQDDVAKRHGIHRNWICTPWDIEHVLSQHKLPFSDSTFSLVTAVWSVQHNSLSLQQDLLAEFHRTLNPGGTALIVSSYSPGCGRHDKDRQDPQYVIGADELKHLTTSRHQQLELTALDYFWYSHNTTDGEFCDHDKANAVAYALRKTVQ